jgi:LysR family transcriptional activator of glutamate synthase operon
MPPNLLRRFEVKHPSVALSINEMSADDVVAAVVQGDAQVGIVGSHPELLGGLDFRLMVRQGVWVRVPSGSPLADKEELSISDMDGQPMVTAGPGNHLHQFFLQKCKEEGVSPNIKATAEGTNALRQLARSSGALYFDFNPKLRNPQASPADREDAPAASGQEAHSSRVPGRTIRLCITGGDDFGTYEIRVPRLPASRAARHFWEMAATDARD